MEAVIDPSGPVIVGYVPPNACRHGGAWETFVTLPVPEGADQETLGVESDGQGGFNFVTDPAKVQARLAQSWSDLRAERNRRLAASDWTQLGDAHMSQERKDAWAQYRQELRDLPDNVTDPTNVTWPPDPTAPVPVQSTGSRLDNLLSHADS